MARRYHRRHHTKSLGGRIRRSFSGFLKLGLGGVVTVLGAYISSVLNGHLSFTLGTNNTVDLGFVPGIIIVGAGLFVMITGLEEAIGTKI
jgi:hypothetical protein